MLLIRETETILERLVRSVEWYVFQLSFYIFHSSGDFKRQLANWVKHTEHYVKQRIVEAVESKEAALDYLLQILRQHDAGATIGPA